MSGLNRRAFLKSTSGLLALAAADLAAGRSAAQDRDPPEPARGETLNVAVIGIRGRGKDHISGLAGRHNCVVTHVCDCDTAFAEGTIRQVAQRQGGRRPEFVQDLRRIMDNRDIHIVTVATPNHWHSLAAIWAMQAGKDVYVEKPVSHNVWEGRRLVEIARATNKICQSGTQIRSSSGVRDAIAHIHQGRMGRVEVARGLCYKRRGSIGRTEGEQALPGTVNYDLWCGPAPRNPLRRRNLHYDWHWTWDYGNGDLGNQGIHQMDVARWALNKNELCRGVFSLGGRFGYVDDGETANTQLCFFDYGDSKLIFEVRGLNTRPYRGANVGNVIHCAEGYVVFPSYSAAIAYDRDGGEIRRWNGGGDHYGNFVRAVRSRRREELTGDVLEGHLSSALCHLGNISYRLGQAHRFQGRDEIFNGDAVGSETMARMEEHLGDNMIDLGSTQYTLGRRLRLDPRSERFVDSQDADRQLTREYRRGFEVPRN